MPTIRVLPDDLASQVAAGEVVERPASAVKELVENSLDAGASQIDVQIEGGGASLLRIADDGCGMDREDALLAIERHATSKIRTREDLDHITTLGFRGEAVPSIASVSRFRLMTRPHHAVSGVELRIDGGKLAEVRDYGGPPGTIIEARDLFFCVPGRRKFLRAESTESGHVEHQVRLHAVAAPGVGFSFLRNGREVFRLPPARGLRERIHGLAGGDLASRLIEVPRHETPEVTVSGLLGPPELARRDRQFCLTFLNGRPIDAKQIGFALREAFGGRLERGLSPVAFLFLELDPALVDVNVHPAKREVRFRDGRAVQEALILAVRAALAGEAKTLLGSETNPGNEGQAEGPDESDGVGEGRGAEPGHPPSDEGGYVKPSLPAAFQRPSGTFQADLPPSAKTDPAAGPPIGAEAQPLTRPSAQQPAPTFEIHGVLDNGIALLEGDEGLVLMDLRAAHERILYEEMFDTSGTPEHQPLLVPEVVELGAQDFASLLEHRSRLGELGFGIEEFGANTIRLTSLPSFLPPKAAGQQLLGLLDELREGGGGSTSKGGRWERALAIRASRQAIPAHSRPSEPEVANLIETLLGCEMPYCAPDGRPTLIQHSYQELDRRFGRPR